MLFHIKWTNLLIETTAIWHPIKRIECSIFVVVSRFSFLLITCLHLQFQIRSDQLRRSQTKTTLKVQHQMRSKMLVYDARFLVVINHIYRRKIWTIISNVIIGEKFKCKMCGKVLETKFSLQCHFKSTHKKECTKDDIGKTSCPPLSATPVEDQDNLIKEQQQEIDNLQNAIKTIKDEIKELRTKLIAKRRLSTELKAGNEKSMIVLRKAY